MTLYLSVEQLLRLYELQVARSAARVVCGTAADWHPLRPARG